MFMLSILHFFLPASSSSLSLSLSHTHTLFFSFLLSAFFSLLCTSESFGLSYLISFYFILFHLILLIES